MHGFMVLHARAGSLLYSHRFSPHYGLDACEQLARDEMRLSAMIFALHLNAASTEATRSGSGAAGLSAYRLGEVTLRFELLCSDQLVLVLFAHAAAGDDAAGFLAAEVARQFEACFGSQLADGATPRGALRRATFAPGLRAALEALPRWILQRMLAIELPPLASAAGDGARSLELRVCGVEALHRRPSTTCLRAWLG